MSEKRTLKFNIDQRLFLLIPGVMVFLLYLPAVGYEFVWDDTIFLRDLPQYRQPGLLLKSLTQPFVLSPNYFRPLVLSTFMLELRFGGLNPMVFHTTNVLLQAINSVLLTYLAYTLLSNGDDRQVNFTETRDKINSTLIISIGAGLIYGLHPALIEGVAFISSRFDLLMTTFLLLGLLADIKLSGKSDQLSVRSGQLLMDSNQLSVDDGQLLVNGVQSYAGEEGLPNVVSEDSVLVKGLRGKKHNLRPILVGLAFLLAALSKEMAVAFTLALPIWHLAQMKVLNPRHLMTNHDNHLESDGNKDSKESLSRKILFFVEESKRLGNLSVYAAILLAGAGYLLIRYASFGYLLDPSVGKGIPTGNILQHFLLVGRSLTEYVSLVIWPFTNLTPIHYSNLPVSMNSPLIWLSTILVFLLVFVLIFGVRTVPRAGWLAIGGVLSLIPVVNLMPLELGGGAFAAERFLLFPLAFFTLAFVSLLGHYRQPIPFFGKAALVLWLIISIATIQLTLPNWHSDLSLWTWTARRAPLSSTPPTNLSLQHINRGDYQAGFNAAQQALDLDNKNSDAWDNAGLALFHLKRYSEAQSAFEKAVSLQPENALFWNNLAGALREQDRLQDAERVLLEHSLRLNPTLPVGHLNLGIVYLRADRPDLAALALSEAIRLLPPDTVAEAQVMMEDTREPDRWLRLGDLMFSVGDNERSLYAYEQAGTLGASQADVASGLSSVLIQNNAWSQAEEVLHEAVEQFPQDARLYNNLGVVARQRGDFDAAYEYFYQAATLAPEWELPQQNLRDLEK